MKARTYGRQSGSKKQPAAPPPREEEPAQLPSRGGSLVTWFAYPGLGLLVAAIACGLSAKPGSAFGESLLRLGLTAGPLGALGLALLATAALLQLQARSTLRLQALEEALEQVVQDGTVIRTNLADLGSIDVAAKLAQVAGGLAPTEIKEMLEKGDEKLNNLTRAIRMFSQPLQDVSVSVEEVKGEVERLEAKLQEFTSALDTVLIRLEELSASLPTRAGRELEERLAASLPERFAELLNPLAENLARLSAAEPGGPATEAPLVDELKTLSLRLSSQLDQALEKLSGFNASAAPEPAQAQPRLAAPVEPVPAPSSGEPAGANVSVLGAIQKLKQMRTGS